MLLSNPSFPAEAVLSTTEISPVEAHDLMVSGEAAIVDVRLAEEISCFGAIPGSVWIPLGLLQDMAGEPIDPAYADELNAMSGQDHANLYKGLITSAVQGKTLLVLCRSGNRSLKAIHLLRSLGYGLCYSVSGGAMEWENAGLPVQFLS